MSSTELPAAIAGEAYPAADEVRRATSAWIETAAVVIFAAAAVLFASFVAVMTGQA
jgi:hypothetical protein